MYGNKFQVTATIKSYNENIVSPNMNISFFTKVHLKGNQRNILEENNRETDIEVVDK